jgi:hypothetical protein
MSRTIQDSINANQPFIEYGPLASGSGYEPAISIANGIQAMVTEPPFTWGWNRKEDSSLNTIAGTQDYTGNITDFGFLEKVTLVDPSGVPFDVSDVYNNAALGVGDPTVARQARPNAVCVLYLTYGTSLRLRFLAVPDKIYAATLTYQKLVAPMSTLTGTTGTWTIPDQYLDIYNALFLGEALAVYDDARSQVYRQRGVTALLAKSEGLTEMQKNLFLEQYWARAGQQQQTALVRQQAQQSRGV